MEKSELITTDKNSQTNILVQTFGDQKRWVNYRLETVDGKTTKVPYAVNGHKSSSTDESTWSTHEEAVRVSDKVGIMFTSDQKLLGIDIDHCLKENEIVHEQKAAIGTFIQQADTYTEISPSGEGLHLFLIITEPLPLLANRNAPFECYTSKRYFTVTGNSFGKTRPVRTVSKDEAYRLLAIIGYPWNKVVKDRSVQSATVLTMDDATVLDKMFASKNGSRIRALYNGDIAGYNNDDSSADMALCAHLAFWTAKNAEQIERMWLASPLGSRNKTQDRKDYRDRTITASIIGCKEVYELKKQQTHGEISTKNLNSAKQSKAVLVPFSDITPLAIQWLWPGRIALGKVTIIAGDPGLGKSLFTTTIAAHVSKGFHWPIDQSVCPIGDVVLLSAEDDEADTIRPRLDAAGADVNRVFLFQAIKEREGNKESERIFSLKRDIPQLEEILSSLPECRLIVIDPISAYLDNTDSHVNAAVRGLMTPLKNLAQKYRVAIVVVSHFSKSGGEKAIYRTQGSLAFVAAARAAYIVTEDPNDPDRRLVLPAKNNIAKKNDGVAYSVVEQNGAPILAWDAEPVTMTANEALSFPKPNEEHTATDEAVDFLQDFLSGRSVKASEAQKEAREAGISAKSLRRAREKLGVKTKKSAFTGGWEWSLLEDAQGSQEALSQSEGILEKAGHLGSEEDSENISQESIF